MKMVNIEDKRKELEEDYAKATLVNAKLYYNEGKLEGFNLGVEMARKEIKDKLDNLIDWIVMQEKNNAIYSKTNYDMSEDFITKVEELKQSLGEKTE